MNPNPWISFISGAIGTVTGILSLIISTLQRRTSNRRQIFSYQEDCWNICRGLYELYVKYNDDLSRHAPGESPDPKYTEDYKRLTSNSFLSCISRAIYNPLDSKLQDEVLAKCEEIEDNSRTLSKLFNRKYMKTFSTFVSDYQELLKNLYVSEEKRAYITRAYDELAKSIVEANNQPDYMQLYSLEAKDIQSIKEHKKVIELVQEMNKLVQAIADGEYVTKIDNQIKK